MPAAIPAQMLVFCVALACAPSAYEVIRERRSANTVVETKPPPIEEPEPEVEPIPPVQESEPPFDPGDEMQQQSGVCSQISVCSRREFVACAAALEGLVAYVAAGDYRLVCIRGEWRPADSGT